MRLGVLKGSGEALNVDEKVLNDDVKLARAARKR